MCCFKNIFNCRNCNQEHDDCRCKCRKNRCEDSYSNCHKCDDDRNNCCKEEKRPSDKCNYFKCVMICCRCDNDWRDNRQNNNYFDRWD